MKSTIRVDFAGGNGIDQGFEPVIRVNLVDSEDTRDKLLREFFQALGGESSWLQVRFENYPDPNSGKPITIFPIRPSGLKLLKEEVGNRFDILGPSGILTVDNTGTVGFKTCEFNDPYTKEYHEKK